MQKALARILPPRTVVQFPRLEARKFEASISGRLTASWTDSPESINSEIYNSLRQLRARSRDLYNNSEYGKHFFSMLVNNVVGPDGFDFQSQKRRRNGQLDERDNERLEMRMAAWSKVGECDVTRRMARREMEALFVLNLAVDGEVIVRKHRGFRNEQGFALQFIDADLLDLDYNEEGGDGRNRIVMGVEIDSYGAPLAYHFLTKHPSPYAYPVGGPANRNVDRIRVDADEIIHAFIHVRPGQTRGIPWVHAAMRALRDLGGYREAAVIAARVGAAKMGFYRSEDGTGAPAMQRDARGNLVDAAEPGTFQQLPEGTVLDSWDPTYPHDQFETFNKAMLRGMAGAMGVAYFNLNNDLESVNLSSARIGQQNERDFYKSVQSFCRDHFHNGWFSDWLALQLIPMGFPMTRFDAFNVPTWRGRTWQSPDPLKDAQTAELYLRNNLVSAPRIIRERGMDPDEVLREIEMWNARLAELGLSMSATETNEDESETESEEDAENSQA